MAAKIQKIEYFLPEKVLTNDQLSEKFPEWDSKKIEDKIGIKSRHIAGEDETALDMAEKACFKLLEGIDKDRIDFLILCTQSPDYFLPASACLLQERLGLQRNTGAFDFNLGCSGFIYGLALSKGLIASGIANTILLVMSETYSKHIHPRDKANLSIFGDASAAVLITRSDSEQIGEFVLGTDGRGYNNLIVNNGCFRNKKYFEKEPDFMDGIFKSPDHLFMNGPEIFNFTIETVPQLVSDIIKKNNLDFEAIDYFVYHQANKYMLDYLRKKSKIPIEKFYNNIINTGNTVSSTVPIALKNLMDQNLIKIGSGKKILLAGFGVGYSWGATIIEL